MADGHAVWLDHGCDNYAGVTWCQAPEDEPIPIGWMRNWDYEANNPLANAPTAPMGVPDTELAAIDLVKENVKPDQRRLRHMTIAPGGVVPFHSHEDRPALIMVNSGEIFEISSKCSAPILHKAGDIARESLGTKHWWMNKGSQPVELTIADIVNDKKPETMKAMVM